MPYAIHMSMIFIPKPCNFWLCLEAWTMEDLKSIYGIIVMALQVYLSLFIWSLKIVLFMRLIWRRILFVGFSYYFIIYYFLKIFLSNSYLIQFLLLNDFPTCQKKIIAEELNQNS